MRLLYSPASPFAAKVRMAAHHVGIPLDTTIVDTTADPAELLAVNPLGKIPTLILDSGESIYDSRVIVEYFDRLSGNLLIPQTDAEWLKARRIEATADGVTDGAILTVYENRFRPEDKRHQPWVDRQWAKATRGLAVLEREVPTLAPEPNIAHFAVAGLLGWMSLRFAGRWESDHPALTTWIGAFAQTFPAYADLKSAG
ncbi:glutathione S-transferase family protein [Antarcticirhabdus aurantiaca]|uniref:Glutathione S-transferase n=1 Tax=Antarcticirhabdus aurantiaca TaxID=2606717 RepID=A0ACD4NV53_9HYPH|nr:glutathione S-transferase [Antarcticirhabdus aurantiaca]WAJ30462.1 glutathione S-transferase [Jeongeuplla avenae]